jgi:hypothetical protein
MWRATLVAAIRDFHQQGSVALGGIARPEDVEIGREFHFAFGVARRKVDVGDDRLGGS